MAEHGKSFVDGGDVGIGEEPGSESPDAPGNVTDINEIRHLPRRKRIQQGKDDPSFYTENRLNVPTWPEILENWVFVEADLQDSGIDVGTGILRERDARWLKVRIIGLLASANTRIGRLFAPKEEVPSGNRR